MAPEIDWAGPVRPEFNRSILFGGDRQLGELCDRGGEHQIDPVPLAQGEGDAARAGRA